MKRIERIAAILLLVLILASCASCQEYALSEMTDEEEPSPSQATEFIIETGSDAETATEIPNTDQQTETGNVTEPETTAAPETTSVPESKLEIYSIDEFSNGLAVISTNEGYGYINYHGKIVIEPCYEAAGMFITELARIKIDGKYGYINTKGEMVIPAQYDSAQEKFDCVAKVEIDGKTQMINSNGAVIYTARKDDIIGDYCYGYFWVESSKETLAGTEKTMIYFDENGKEVARFANAKNAELYSSSNKYGFAYIFEIIQKGSGWYKDECEYSLVNLNNGNIELRNIKAVNGRYFFDSNSDVKYVSTSFSMYDNTEIDLHIGSASIFNKLNQTFTPLHKNGEWYAYYYLCAPRGIWDGYFANRANEDIINEYSVDMTYITQTPNRIIADLKNNYPELSGGYIKGIAGWEYDGKMYFPVLLKNQNGTFFSTIIDPSGDLVVAPHNDYELGYSESKTENYMHYRIYEFYSGDSGVSELSCPLVIAKDPRNGLFGYVNILNGKWVIQPQYTSVTDFSGDGMRSVAVVNGNTIIDINGHAIFTVAQ